MIRPNIPLGPPAAPPRSGVRIAGAGAYVPTRTINNESIARAVPAWSASWIENKTSIRERRFLCDFDQETGAVLAPPVVDGEPGSNTDMCEIALRRALEMGGVPASDLDAVFVVTCTPDRLNFNHDAMDLHRRLGCRSDAYALVVDDGCGGTPYVMDMVYRMIRTGAIRTAAVIGSTCTSAYMDREVWTSKVSPGPGAKPLRAALSMYLFGDGAGAVILQADPDPEKGIVASMSGNDYLELVIRRAGGVLDRLHPGTSPADDAFVVNGQLVAESYPLYMGRCVDALFEARPDLQDQVQRFYFHQPNKRLMDHFITGAGLPADRVAYNVDRYGNTSAAGMLILLAEDLENGTVRMGSGDVVMIAAVGANVHYGAQLVRL